MLDKNDVKYIPIFLGTCYLLPQIYSGYKSKKLKDVSTLSLFLLIISSLPFSYYLYVTLHEEYFSFAIGFITLNAVIILCMKYTYYVLNLTKKLKELDCDSV